jgi:hypothetical protein
LIAGNFEFFAFRSPFLPRSAEIRTARITAGLAALGMTQSTLAVIFLLSFSKGKCISAFGASDFKIWHRYLLKRFP